MMMRKRARAARGLAAAAAMALLPACSRSDRGASSRSAGRPHIGVAIAPPHDTVPLRGVYRRDRDAADFRVCGAPRPWTVLGADSLMSVLDANVDWHAPRPTTTMYVLLRGDTTREGADADREGTLTLVDVDSMRGLAPGECAPRRPDTPPTPAPAAVNAAIRAALGADSALATPATVQTVAVWLDNDSRGDLLALLRAPKLCELAGCTLLVFAGTPEGYQLIGRTTSVVAPIQLRQRPNPEAPDGIEREMTEGHVDIQVLVNGGAFGMRDAILRYRDGHYPRNAAFEPPPGGRRGLAEPNGTTVLRAR